MVRKEASGGGSRPGVRRCCLQVASRLAQARAAANSVALISYTARFNFLGCRRSWWNGTRGVGVLKSVAAMELEADVRKEMRLTPGRGLLLSAY